MRAQHRLLISRHCSMRGSHKSMQRGVCSIRARALFGASRRPRVFSSHMSLPIRYS
jgi:hypothetical protein